jgi:hypothetical protein
MKYTNGMIFLQGFMTIGIGVQAILKFSLTNLKRFNVRISLGRDV